MKTILLTLTAIVLAALATAARAAPIPEPGKVYTEDEAFRIGWPQVAGPTSNWMPLPTGASITRDLLKARIAWRSADHDFGTAKTGSKTFGSAADIMSRLGPDAVAHPGNWAGVIVAEGKVFGSSFRPTGPFHKATADGKPIEYRIDAEDLVIALDARTGKAAWKAVEPGGLVVAGGKRGGFQVAPVYADGKVFAMGSTGRLFAYDAATGRRLWQGDIGATHEALEAERKQKLEAAASGQWVEPSADGWHTSLVYAGGMLIAPDYRGTDTGLLGIDPATGERRWHVPEAVSKYATPSVWHHGDREYVLSATLSGKLHLIDPADGRVLWEVTGLGPNFPTLAPGGEYVLVNVAADSHEKGVGGYWGAYHITPERAEPAWKLPREPAYQIPTGFDSCARQRYTIAAGRAWVQTDGTRETPGRFLLLDAATGRTLAEHVNRGGEPSEIGGLFYVLGDRVLSRVDSFHGPTHGGRHPIVQWSVIPGGTERMDPEAGLCALDLAEFATAYEVLMEAPVVAGRMYERTLDGGLVCYDLREPEGLATWTLTLQNGWIGVGPLPTRLWIADDGALYAGRDFPPTDRVAGLPYTQCRRWPRWERIENVDARRSGDALAGTVRLGFGSHTWPTELVLTRSGAKVSGTWKREIAGLEAPAKASGKVTGRGPSRERIYPTPWLADQPWTVFGENPRGAATYVLQMPGCIAVRESPADLTVCLDVEGGRVVRAAGTAHRFSQAWHEVDASGLEVRDGRITGTMIVVANGDWWVMPNPAADSGIAGRIRLDARAAGDAIEGTYESEFGIPWTATGSVEGEVTEGR